VVLGDNNNVASYDEQAEQPLREGETTLRPQFKPRLELNLRGQSTHSHPCPSHPYPDNALTTCIRENGHLKGVLVSQ
jgi:hypothetical protein